MKLLDFLRGSRRTAGQADLAAERTAAVRRAAAMALQLVRNGGTHLIAIAAPSGGEGASTVAETLAESLGAHSGGRVVLIDGVREGAGVTAHDWLKTEDATLDMHLRQDPHSSYARLQGFAVDRFPDSRGAEAFTSALRAVCDVAVVVLPPLLTHPEALSLAARLDGVVLVLEAERTRWEVAREAKHLLDSIGVKVLGAILNKRPRHIPGALYRRL